MTAAEPETVPEAAFIQRQRRFADQIRNPDQPLPAGIDARRMHVYVELFFNNISGFLAGAFPVYRSLCTDAIWQAEVRRFMREYAASSPLFRDLALAYRQYVDNLRAPQPEDPPFLGELLHYEWVELALDIAEDDPFSAADPVCAAQLLNEHPHLSPLAWPLRYDWPVHQISPDFCPDTPPPQPTWLLVYRNRADAVRFMELNALSARLLALLQVQPVLTGLEALQQLAAEQPDLPDEAVLQHGLALLQQFWQDDILLGTTPVPPTHPDRIPRGG
ncbi:HvfC family RiPP maturation protein [Marinobacterium weihaiense]|uniref:DNA-binding domain-containing protein n=1 Tax=Marinobacterium weihaiense TaxID=2851016 RepID=A0ABS6M8G1_9GAMM|nr:putative DNA-binding domain-containing protein [Marinobacterium weihaiense]MBV0932568.1 putative DNA-binding domain-containing protein [Marinobacterium weihaiense]